MYIPDLYLNQDKKAITAFIHEHSFGLLINQTNGKLTATHIPLALEINTEGKEILCGHLSKENPQWKGFTEKDQILAVFSGAHSYISSSWYDHENVPTWNYSAVHIYGKIKIIEGEAVIESLARLVDKYEKNVKCPVRVENYLKKQCYKLEELLLLKLKSKRYKRYTKCLKTVTIKIIPILYPN